MRQREIRIVHVELQRMTGLAIGGEADAVHVTTFFVGHVARRAFELPTIDGWNVRGEVPLMIKVQRVGIACVIPLQLELWMT